MFQTFPKSFSAKVCVTNSTGIRTYLSDFSFSPPDHTTCKSIIFNRPREILINYTLPTKPFCPVLKHHILIKPIPAVKGNTFRLAKEKVCHRIRTRKCYICRIMCVYFRLIQGQICTRCRGLQSERGYLCRYAENISGKPRLEQINIVVIGKTYFCETVSHSSGVWEAAARVKLTSHQWNTNVMMVVGYNVPDMAGLSPEC